MKCTQNIDMVGSMCYYFVCIVSHALYDGIKMTENPEFAVEFPPLKESPNFVMTCSNVVYTILCANSKDVFSSKMKAKIGMTKKS
ncbi:hypothetical protein PFUGPA_05939 [Plasmodium falciparum Palo Alto/Uganda]|uniref:Uncharacterized protein n=1 Tax=Plasmodium falciparum (isolate Palo Alto / Uganda) TaxID=57270 RepID=W4IQ04_PLAFP|nr:hypothetical protein PFUGPA_05939 [Plasmodium falciparum Palo Alto/Uganda]